MTVTRWETRAAWWRGRQRLPGLVLDIDGHGTTLTYGTRNLDTAREMVLEYLRVSDVPVTDDATIIWTEHGN
ncbi:hypothetical protein [Prescottella agglutinans]|uniref:hypothetical protein n=1 Tax=Prescottella agglutinans TaxID=1644129 RepID=UPI0024755511|nr:hypothetical protein [Prescottella agglutinans]